MLQDCLVSSPAEIGILVPDDVGYGQALAEAFDRVGLLLSGQSGIPGTRDLTGVLLLVLLTLLEVPASRTALASLYSSRAMPWPRETGCLMAREVIDRGWSRTARNLDGAGRIILDAIRPSETCKQLTARLLSVAEVLPDLLLSQRIAALGIAADGAPDWSALRRRAEPRPQDATGHDRFVEGVSLFTENTLPWRPVRHLIALGLAGRYWPRMPAANPVFTEGEIRLIRDETGLVLPGRREKLARGLELFRRQL